MQHRPVLLIAGKHEPKRNIACRIEQLLTKTRHARQGQATGNDRAAVYSAPRIYQIR
jgi:hypothetical protein